MSFQRELLNADVLSVGHSSNLSYSVLLFDENADCLNNEGSYICTFKDGFTGNGTLCSGKLFGGRLVLFLHSCLLL